MDGCETMKCIDYKDGKCHYESSMCKYQESRMEGQEAKDLLFEAQQLIKELEAHALKMEDLADKNLKNTLVLQDNLKKAEDILNVMLNAKGNIKMLHSALVATEDYFKKK